VHLAEQLQVGIAGRQRHPDLAYRDANLGPDLEQLQAHGVALRVGQTEGRPQMYQSYFRVLPFAPAEIACLTLPEILAEKIRACYQRNKARDIYDLGIQGVLRHSRIATTTDVYMQEIPESVQKTVDPISAELRPLPNLEEVTRGTRVLLPNATKLKSGVSASS
jgi:predicted nucleotidyltransferase component of viral defense system